MNHHLGNGFFGGWTPPKPDHLRAEYLPTVTRSSVPDTFELPGVATIPKINQGQQGACTGHGTDGVLMYDEQKQGLPLVIRSRAMIYYDARIPEGTTGQDAGASVADAVDGVVKYGTCTDQEFPYNDQVFDVAPSDENYAEAAEQEARLTETVSVADVDRALVEGYAVVDGMTVYESMMSAQVASTGVVPFPKRGDQPAGGHCTWTFGYNNTDEPWTSPSGLVYPPFVKAKRNSWQMPDGTWWGDQGNFFLPLKFWTEGLVTDAHIVRRLDAA
jgi:hypothetical protein